MQIIFKLIYGTLTGTATLDQTGPGSNDNVDVNNPRSPELERHYQIQLRVITRTPVV